MGAPINGVVGNMAALNQTLMLLTVLISEKVSAVGAKITIFHADILVMNF